MAVYPAGNPGVYPLVTTSDVGKFRLASGDTQSTAYDPVYSGYQSYTYASDAEIEQFLALSGDSVPGAVGYWYLQLAGQAAISAQNVKDYDLSINTEKRASELRAQAEYWFGLAGIPISGAEYFDIVTTGDPCYPYTPELAEPPYSLWY